MDNVSQGVALGSGWHAPLGLRLRLAPSFPSCTWERTCQRARLDDSVEAWVHVVLDINAAPLLSGFDPESNRAILTWENSD